MDKLHISHCPASDNVAGVLGQEFDCFGFDEIKPPTEAQFLRIGIKVISASVHLRIRCCVRNPRSGNVLEYYIEYCRRDLIKLFRRDLLCGHSCDDISFNQTMKIQFSGERNLREVSISCQSSQNDESNSLKLVSH